MANSVPGEATLRRRTSVSRTETAAATVSSSIERRTALAARTSFNRKMYELKYYDDTMDIEQFIDEVKNRPILWNTATEDYHDRTKKKNAWNGIGRLLCEDYDTRNEIEQSDIRRRLISKWRNIKDNYQKSMRKNAKFENGKRYYIYARQLSFLHEAGVFKKTNNTSPRGDKEDEIEIDDKSAVVVIEPERTPRRYEHNTRKRKRNLESTPVDTDKAITQPQPTQSQSTVEKPEYNADRSFFESLLPSLRDFNEDQKLDFRCEVLNIVKSIRKRKATS